MLIIINFKNLNKAQKCSYLPTISLGASDVNNSAKGSFERWINTVKSEELGFAIRKYQVEQLNSGPKTKQNHHKLKEMKP